MFLKKMDSRTASADDSGILDGSGASCKWQASNDKSDGIGEYTKREQGYFHRRRDGLLSTRRRVVSRAANSTASALLARILEDKWQKKGLAFHRPLYGAARRARHMAALIGRAP